MTGPTDSPEKKESGSTMTGGEEPIVSGKGTEDCVRDDAKREIKKRAEKAEAEGGSKEETDCGLSVPIAEEQGKSEALGRGKIKSNSKNENSAFKEATHLH